MFTEGHHLALLFELQVATASLSLFLFNLVLKGFNLVLKGVAFKGFCVFLLQRLQRYVF